MACLTAAATSPGLDFHVPRPATGMEWPLESFTLFEAILLTANMGMKILTDNKRTGRKLSMATGMGGFGTGMVSP